MADSTAKTRPSKPSPQFPLFPHRSGRWAKKVQGKFAYFGSWSNDPKGESALALWLSQKDDLLAGRTPRKADDGLTVRDLCNAFLTSKRHQFDTREITRRTFDDYHRTCEKIIQAFGKNRPVDDLRPEDFEKLRGEIAKTNGPVSLGNHVTKIKVVFNFAFNAGLIDKPIRFGPTFKKPAQRILRAERQKKGQRMFEARQIRRLLKAATPAMRAMILMGANCGFGNSDIGNLPLTAIDLDRGWISYPRPKTAIERRCPLWPETIQALREALAERPAAAKPEFDRLALLTRFGTPWAKDVADSPISKEFRKLLDKLKMHRPGLGFYCLRHVLETIGGECGDQIAVNSIMGHCDSSMSAHYRERISDERLIAVSCCVRGWLFRRSSAELWKPIQQAK